MLLIFIILTILQICEAETDYPLSTKVISPFQPVEQHFHRFIPGGEERGFYSMRTSPQGNTWTTTVIRKQNFGSEDTSDPFTSFNEKEYEEYKKAQELFKKQQNMAMEAHQNALRNHAKIMKNALNIQKAALGNKFVHELPESGEIYENKGPEKADSLTKAIMRLTRCLLRYGSHERRET
ncbi:unnamed protein product [Caenorhabditis auriculariae]|uniref:SXP/RAL-2 family protein Ani s 5-like cation-binding domain-containing protein n=1 Tax=Caenorhabditis auriculariae TaxID=2777116 RepID=A0A8S1HU84_9PELO|nr:unnamed protein product [Caenorhabditis auriculariae]